MKYLLICCLSAQLALTAQPNMIPNSDFESTAQTPACVNSHGPNFNAMVNNWKTKSFHTSYIVSSLCFGPLACNSTGQGSWAMIRSHIPLLFPCSNRELGEVGVALLNGATFPTGVPLVIRYKINRVGGTNNAPSPSCIGTITNHHLRIFGSVNGPLNWQDNNNTVEEIFNANFQAAGVQSSCGWELIERNFTLSTSGLTTLAFLAQEGGFYIDDVEVFPQCSNSYLIQNQNYGANDAYDPGAVNGGNFKEMAGTNLTAGDNVGAPGPTGPVLVGDNFGQNSKIIYTAQSNITLKQGFSAFLGSDFHAVLDAACPNNITSRSAFKPNPVGNFEELVGKNHRIVDQDFVAGIDLKVYPNPTAGDLLVELPADGNLEIRNLLGQLIYSAQLTSGKHQLTIADAKAGIYMLNYKSGTNDRTMKIVKH